MYNLKTWKLFQKKLVFFQPWFRPTKHYRYGADVVEVGFVGSLKQVNGTEPASTSKAFNIAQNSGNGCVSFCKRSTRQCNSRAWPIGRSIDQRPFKSRPTTTKIKYKELLKFNVMSKSHKNNGKSLLSENTTKHAVEETATQWRHKTLQRARPSSQRSPAKIRQNVWI